MQMFFLTAEYFINAWSSFGKIYGWDLQCCLSFHQRQLIKKASHTESTFFFHDLSHQVELSFVGSNILCLNTPKWSGAMFEKYFCLYLVLLINLNLCNELAFVYIRKLSCKPDLSINFVFVMPALIFAPGDCMHFAKPIWNMLYLCTIKMVVLTIVTQKNGKTVYFDEPIPKLHFIKLMSWRKFIQQPVCLKKGRFSSIGQSQHGPLH